MVYPKNLEKIREANNLKTACKYVHNLITRSGKKNETEFSISSLFQPIILKTVDIIFFSRIGHFFQFLKI